MAVDSRLAWVYCVAFALLLVWPCLLLSSFLPSASLINMYIMYIHDILYIPGTETKHVINGVWVIDETIRHAQEREADLSIRLHHPQKTCRDTHSLHLKLKQNVNNNNNNMYMSELLRQTVNLAGRRGLIRTRPQSLIQGRGSMSDGDCGRSVWTGRGETGTEMDGYCMMDALKKEREGRRERGGRERGGGERERGGRRERGRRERITKDGDTHQSD